MLLRLFACRAPHGLVVPFALGRFASSGRESQVASFKVRAQGAEGQ
jgi:hypothetical protein